MIEPQRRAGKSRLVYDKATRTIRPEQPAQPPPLLCRLIGHAWRTERRYSKPGGFTEIVEVVMDKRSGAMCAAAAVAQGLTPRITGRVCARCDTRSAVSPSADDAKNT